MRVAIPKPVMQALGLIDMPDMQVKNGVIELRPVVVNPGAGRVQGAQRIALESDNVLVWPAFANEADADLKG